MISRYDRLYEPAPQATPWPLRQLAKAGGLTPVGIFAAFLIAMPMVLGGVVLAWEAFGL